MAKDIKFEDIQIGDTAGMSKTVTEYDVYGFAGITGDFNPVHINEVEAQKSMFKGRIAHGMISAGFISAVLGMELPGAGTIYLGQELKFLAPVRIGDTITATVEVIEKDEVKHRLTLKTVCTNQDGKVVTDGTAKVMKK